MYARCRILTITSLYGLSCSRPCTKFIHRSVSRTSAFLHTAPKKKKARLTFKPVPRAKPIELSDEQQHVHDMVLAGNSVFFTGSAGTGKSVLLRRIIQSLREKDGTGGAVAVTASTGIAAINIGGTTLHAFAGVGLGKGSTVTMIERARKNPATRKRLRSAKVLVIDEISMVDGRWFDKLNDLLKSVRRTQRRPFGGLQLVICGDFFQLPPVPDEPRDGEDTSVKFAFQAECWDRAVPNIIRLTKVFRQRQPQLIALLNDLREGVVSPETEQLLTRLSREVHYKHGIRPTELFPHRRSADAANQRHMDRLDGEKLMFVAEDTFEISEEQGELSLDKMIPKEIELGVGAQVMCTRNITDTIVNGSVGVITEFAPLDLWPKVQFDNGETMIMEPEEYEHQDESGKPPACRKQVPLILAWALTIHKAQGQTLARVKVDLAHAFANGQAYVALSRCTTLEGLQVLNFHRGVVFVDPAVVEWSKKLAVIADK